MQVQTMWKLERDYLSTGHSTPQFQKECLRLSLWMLTPQHSESSERNDWQLPVPVEFSHFTEQPIRGRTQHHSGLFPIAYFYHLILLKILHRGCTQVSSLPRSSSLFDWVGVSLKMADLNRFMGQSMTEETRTGTSPISLLLQELEPTLPAWPIQLVQPLSSNLFLDRSLLISHVIPTS